MPLRLLHVRRKYKQKKGGERNEAAERHKVGAKWANREGRPFDATVLVPRPLVLAAQVLSAK